MLSLAFVPRVVSVEGASIVQVLETATTSEQIIPIRIHNESERDIIEYIYKTFGKSGGDAVRVFRCESGLKTTAFNLETQSKERGVTKWSSCGIAQINSPLCHKEVSPLYDYRHNIEVAKEMFDARGWKPWKICAIKYDLLN